MPPNPEAKTVVQFKVYKRRWFALLVLCLLNCSNAMVSESSCCKKPVKTRKEAMKQIQEFPPSIIVIKLQLYSSCGNECFRNES